MTHKEYLVVFITVQNFVGIGTVVFITQMFDYFACLALKCLCMYSFECFWGENRGKWKLFISLGI